MPYIPEMGAITKALKKIRDELSPYIDRDNMRELDREIDKCFSDIKMHIQHAIYQQVANAIEKSKLKNDLPKGEVCHLLVGHSDYTVCDIYAIVEEGKPHVMVSSDIEDVDCPVCLKMKDLPRGQYICIRCGATGEMIGDVLQKRKCPKCGYPD